MNMMEIPPRSMFVDFQLVHEDCLVMALNGLRPQPALVVAALTALDRCRSEIIDELKSADAMQRRGELRILYEGLTLAAEFIKQDESVPAVRDY